MFATARANWALLLGVALIMLGYGLSATLLGVRAEIEGFPTAVIGLIMSGYSVGFLLAAIYVQDLIIKVGHVRVFAAVTAVASATILAHPVFVSPISWGLLRVITGFCMAGVYICAESWLNRAADNENRGSLLSVYMIVSNAGLSASQFLLNLADPADFQLFVAVSVLISVAVVPMLLTAAPAPVVVASQRFGLRDLYRSSPLGFVGMLGTGVTNGALFQMGAVYASQVGFTLSGIATFMAAAILGGLVLQFPIGRLSDFLDRRQVITAVSVIAGATTLAVWAFGGVNQYTITALFFLYGGLGFPLYSLCVAHTNDHLDAEQMVGASSRLAFVCGVGMVVGPFAASVAMQAVGAAGFPLFLAVAHAGVATFAIYRMTRRSALPRDEQSTRTYAAPFSSVASPVAVAIAQEATVWESENEPETVQSVKAESTGTVSA